MNKMLIVVISILFLVISFIGCIGDDQNTDLNIIYVDDGGGADFTQIQHAIDNVSEGYTVYVREGIYYEQLLINKSINLIGESKDKTVIKLNKSSISSEKYVINIQADNCEIRELKIVGDDYSSHFNGININTSNNKINNNILLEFYKGVSIEHYKGISGKYSNNNNISSNILSNNFYGIYLDYSDDNVISKNNISLSTFDGIHLFVSDNNIVFGNKVTDCKFNGIRIKASDYNTVFGNWLVKNKIGVYCCCGAGHNVIYRNNFEKNTELNGRDDINNKWYNDSMGNYWDDYNGTDTDGDDIGDSPYNISSLVLDEFPIMNPIEDLWF
jgi:parallel beta-helix repeat protein